MSFICLVGCGKQKLHTPSAAKNLYCSSHFKLKRRFAELITTRWYILSAEHHLVKPDQIVKPYDMSLNSKINDNDRRLWAKRVFEQLAPLVQPNDTLVILAGRHYSRYLCQHFPDNTILSPLQGRIGQQNQQLKRATENEDIALEFLHQCAPNAR